MSQKRIKRSVGKLLYKIALSLLTIAIGLGITLYLTILLILKGPSPSLSNLLMSTLMETKTFKNTNIARLFFNEEELEAIKNRNNISDTSLVTEPNAEFEIDEALKDKIEIIDIKGATYEGKLMIIYDPSRVSLAVSNNLDSDAAGFFVEEYVASLGAVAGINAGGFQDDGGQGNGGQAYGIVIKEGELISGKLEDYTSVVGFTYQNKLMVGNMTAQQALEYGMRDAVTFGPIFIVDFVPIEITGVGGGLNPRTVIGQRADGAVLLLTIDGRQTTSLGASYKDCIDIMMKYEAMNAANLDGGSSTVMVHEGQIINNVVSMLGDRRVPTAWIVK